MAKIKVLVDIYYLHVAQTGIKTYIECLCEEIEKGDRDEFEFIISPSRESIADSTFFKGNTSFWKNLLYQAVYFFRKLVVLPLLSIRHQTDIVLSPDILSPVWARGKKISVIHDAFFWENPEHYNPIWLKVYLTVLKWGLRGNAYVITISEYSKKQIQKHLQMPALPVHVVYPSSNIKSMAIEHLETSPLNSPYFLHVGVMEIRKNLPVLIEAFAQLVEEEGLGDYKLVLVGQRGPRKTLDDYDNILSLIKQLQLEGKVILPGYVSRQELESYYLHAVAYVFPSFNEGFGMPILESFSYGLPVIVANQDTLKEVGGDAVLVVSENTPDGFERALLQIAKNDGLRKQLKERGKQRLQRFSSDNFFLSLKDCLRRIINE